VKLSQLKGKVALLHFFGTFSQTSQKQLPQIEKINQKYKDQGLAVIGITLEKDREKVQTFATQNKLSYPILLDGKTVLKDYKLSQIPDVCVVGKDGIIASIYAGYNSCNEGKIKTDIERLLKVNSGKK